MKIIPETENALVLRTDFSEQSTWDLICKMIQKPVGLFGFRANVDFLSDEEYSNMTKEQLMSLIPKDYNHAFIMVVDQTTISHPDHPLLVIDLFGVEIENEFRAIPSQIQAIENNLSIANMDFEDFASEVGEDGIFRGYGPHLG